MIFIKDFIRIAAASPSLKVADCLNSADEIIKIMHEVAKNNTSVIVFPELCITGYTCADLFSQDSLINAAERALSKILEQTKELELFTAVGLPIRADNQLFNCAACIFQGKILGLIPKVYLPNYTEFYDDRWFSSGENLKNVEMIDLCNQSVCLNRNIIFSSDLCKIAIEICEDAWAVIPPSSYHALEGAEIILNLSASNELVYKDDYRKELIKQQSGRIIGVYAYANAGIGESTTDLVFSGHNLICENGAILSESLRFLRESNIIYADCDLGRIRAERRRISTFAKCKNSRGECHSPDKDYTTIKFAIANLSADRQVNRKFAKHPFIPNESERDKRCKDIFDIQVAGLAKRLEHTNAKTAVIGISGGLDSTLALLCTVKAFDYLGKSRENIIGVTMPGFGTTDRTYNNALSLMQELKISFKEISIVQACLQHFKDINHDPNIKDVTYENVQARERTQILMDIANKSGGLVIGTGDLSEIALGWSTYNGDHMSMYAVNCGIPKTLVRVLVGYVADIMPEVSAILRDVLDTPVSPELLPADNNGQIAQKTEDIVGPYELHDFYLYYVMRFGLSPKKIALLAELAFEGEYSIETIKKWLTVFYKRFFSQQFKRSCIPDGPKVGSVGLSPRGDLKMPSDACVGVWLREIEDM